MDLDIVILFLQQGIASGLVTGSVYALLALAIVIVFRTTEVANFAEGELYMSGAYLAFFLVSIVALPYWVALPATVLGILAIAGTFHRLVLRHVSAGKGVAVNLVISTLGLSYVLKGIVRATGFGDTPRSFSSPVPDGTVAFGAASLSYLDLVILAAAIVVMAIFFALLNLTRTGRAMRALGMNRKAAQLVGINVQRIEMLVWVQAGSISAIAAILIAPKLLMTAEMGDVVTLAFAAAIVGGFTSLPGAVVGGFIVGIVENLVGLFLSSRAITVAPFIVIMLVLIFMPQGLFGGRVRMRKV